MTLMERELETDIEKMNLEKTTLIPRKGIQEIKKLCDNEEFLELGFDEKQAIAKTENSLLIVRLLNGDFPDYRNIIKAISKELFVEIDRLSLISALKRINLFTEDIFGKRLIESEEGIVLSSRFKENLRTIGLKFPDIHISISLFFII